MVVRGATGDLMQQYVADATYISRQTFICAKNGPCGCLIAVVPDRRHFREPVVPVAGPIVIAA